MPTLADITVKKADGSTDIIYKGVLSSSGDSAPAMFRCDAASTQNSGKPTLLVSSKFNGPKTGRRVLLDYEYPQTSTDSTTGLISVANRIPIHIEALIPLAVPDTIVAEAVHQATGLLASVLIRETLKSGFAPRG